MPRLSAFGSPALLLTLGLLSYLPLSLPAQELGDRESRIVEAVADNQDRAVALLQETVEINSGTLNAPGQRAVYDAMAPRFEALGFEVEYVQPDVPQRGGHLVARRRGGQGKHLLLIGHMDTVFEEDSPFQRWERLNDSIARGPGVGDMKGGNVVIWSALEALHREGTLENTSITVVLTGDEERPGRPLDEARRALVEAGMEADIALGFEGGTPGLGVVARRSSSSWRIDITATTAHSSGVFRDGVGAGAIYEAGRILEDFYSEIRGEENLTFNAATLVAGTEASWDEQTARGTAFGKTNVVPPTAILTGDIRTLTNEQLERTREAMQAIVARSLPGTESTITFSDGYPSMPPTEGNYELLEMLSQVGEAVGTGPVEPFDPGRRGAADISFVADYVEAGLDGLGPDGSGSHTVEETVNLLSLERAAKRAAILIHRLTRSGATVSQDPPV
jgi:glutamate carboxypeptidase